MSENQRRTGTARRPPLHFLAGSSVTGLMGTLWRHGGVSAKYCPQLLLLAACVLLRLPGCAAERLRVARRVRRASFDPPPVIIVGHWRSGTTFLHNLMSRDPRFCHPTILDALRPYDFYPNPFEFISRRVLLRFVPPMRPMDDMRVDPDLPQEDELALATMGAPSFLNCFYFPARTREVFAQEVLFEGADERILNAWRQALSYYLAKLAALHPGRQLLLKNPAHSARIPHLRAMFPGAKFIHIHRDPAEVFQSTRKLYRSMLAVSALQDYRSVDIDEHILWSYPALMTRLLDALDDLPDGTAIALQYDELVADPVKTVNRIYRELNLGNFELVRPAIAAYATDHRRTATPQNIDPQTASRLASRWDAVRKRLGYPSPEPSRETAIP
jgi:omega-hydroxy-beta-dihydromenaquinone-9 sulfotransferase